MHNYIVCAFYKKCGVYTCPHLILWYGHIEAEYNVHAMYSAMVLYFAAMYSYLLASAVPAYHLLSSLAQQKLLSNIMCICIGREFNFLLFIDCYE